jgi:alpha-mannosidase
MLADALTSLGFEDANAKSGQPVLINTLPWARPAYVDSPGSQVLSACTAGDYGVSEITTERSAALSVKEVRTGVFVMESAQFTVTISNGVITSIYDKTAEREIVPEGQKANQLVLFSDLPLNWQAWDVEVYHLESRQELTPEKTMITEKSSYSVAVTTETRISEKSSIRTTVSLRAARPGDSRITPIEITADVDWHEDRKFLKVEFPVDIRNTTASYETQYGIVTRPTHYNTDWDMAKFEVCCHKWADLSESGYGVSILNDCKYGFATVGNVMRLSLLRSPKAPDEHADMGKHHFKYAILPHAGPLDSRTIRAGYEFNNPIATPQRSLASTFGSIAISSGDKIKGNADTSLFPYTGMTSYIRTHPSPSTIAPLLSSIRMSSSSNPAIILDTIKRGEDDEDVSRRELPVREGKSIILRLFDSLGGKARGRVELGEIAKTGLVKWVGRTNLLEDDEVGGRIEVKNGSFEVELGAFEVRTWRVQLK